MKILKKISLVYVLQIFAVILLFGYAGSTSENETKEVVTDGIIPLKINKQSPVKPNEDSILTGNLNGLWNVNTAKGW